MVDMTDRVVLADAPAVAEHVAGWLADRIAASQGPFRLALSGGSTPKALFAVLARPDFAGRIPWARLHLFWGDERYVAYDSPDSNYGEAKRILLDRVPIPAANVHPFPDLATPEAAATAYAETLQAEYGSTRLDAQRPLFDINMLGIGEDGHTASLIPGEPVLQNRTDWTAVVGHGRPAVRLTMTYPILESARVVCILAVGAAKAPIIAKLAAGAIDVPAGMLRPIAETIWFLDRASAALL